MRQYPHPYRKAFIPGSDGFLFSGIRIDGFNLPECIIGLGIYEIDISTIQGIPNIVIERIGIKVSVYAGDGDHNRIGGALFFRPEKNTVQYRASFCRDI